MRRHDRLERRGQHRLVALRRQAGGPRRAPPGPAPRPGRRLDRGQPQQRPVLLEVGAGLVDVLDVGRRLGAQPPHRVVEQLARDPAHLCLEGGRGVEPVGHRQS